MQLDLTFSYCIRNKIFYLFLILFLVLKCNNLCFNKKELAVKDELNIMKRRGYI